MIIDHALGLKGTFKVLRHAEHLFKVERLKKKKKQERSCPETMLCHFVYWVEGTKHLRGCRLLTVSLLCPLTCTTYCPCVWAFFPTKH